MDKLSTIGDRMWIVGMDRAPPAVAVRRGEGAQRTDMDPTFSISRLHFLKVGLFRRDSTTLCLNLSP